MRETLRDPKTLDRPDWNDLESNYDKHDIGEAYLVGRVHEMGLSIEQWGIDMRHHDDGLIFDNKMDLRLWQPRGDSHEPSMWPHETDSTFTGTRWEDPLISIGDERDEWDLAACCDVKTKASESWLGKFNLRHLGHYAHWADEHGVPTFIYMTMVDVDAERVGDVNYVIPITTDWNYSAINEHYSAESNYQLSYGELKDTSRECDIVHNTFRAPDGNLVVETNESVHHDFDWIRRHVL